MRFLYKNILFWSHEKLCGRNTLRYFNLLKTHNSYNVEEIRAHQLVKLRNILLHCKENIPYFTELLADYPVSDIKNFTIDDLKRLPILTKGLIRENLDSLIDKSSRQKLYRYSTGGSTGKPLSFYTDMDKEAWHNAHKLRCRNWYGLVPGDKQVDIWGSPIELNKRSLFRTLKDKYMLRHTVLSAFDMTDKSLDSYYNYIKKNKPKLIYGYPSAIYILSKFIKKEVPQGFHGYPSLVVCTSEMLYDFKRELIKDVMGCPVINEYGSREAGLIAYECPEGKMHIVSEHVIVEIVNQDANGIGDVVVTNLDGYGMPFIRYSLGDRASFGKEECSCGLPYPMLEGIMGRSNDVLYGKNNKIIYGAAPVYVIREYAGKVNQFKVVQKKDKSIQILLSCEIQLSDSELLDIKERVGKIFENEVPVNIMIVDKIESDKSGKYRTVASEYQPRNT